MKKYKVTLNKKQLATIAISLEDSARLILGQFNLNYQRILDDVLWNLHYKEGKDNTEYYRIKNEVDNHLNEIKKLIWNNSTKGIGHNKESDLMYEIYKNILSQFEKEREEECLKKGEKYVSNVHSGDILKLTNEEFIKIEKIDEEERKS